MPKKKQSIQEQALIPGAFAALIAFVAALLKGFNVIVVGLFVLFLIIVAILMQLFPSP